MIEDSLKILVVSDIHSKHSSYKKDEKNTNLISDKFRLPASHHPVQALLDKIESDNELRANIVLCAGDICDKIDHQGLISGWTYLEEITSRIGAHSLISCVGNHDINTHSIHQEDTFYAAKSLNKNYPINDSNAKDEFWSKYFCTFIVGECIILIFNSTWSFTKEDLQPRIDQRTLDEMKHKLTTLNASSFKFKIALSHHHPIHHSNISIIRDTDLIDKGDKLIQLLLEFDFQIYIHGHKHDPKLSFSNTLPIFCAGSFSSLENIVELGARNVFHLVNLVGGQRKGTIETFEYSTSSGWESTKMDTYFPSFTGFGCTNLIETARNCIDWFKSQNKDMIKFEILLHEFPEINYLTKDEQLVFNQLLISENITLTEQFPNRPRLITILY